MSKKIPSEYLSTQSIGCSYSLLLFLGTYTALAFLLRDFGDHDESIKIWDKMSEITPDDRWIPFNKATIFLNQNKFEEALEGLEEILTEDKQEKGPSKAVIMNQKGWILYKMKKYEESMEWIKKSLAIEPKNAHAIDSKAEVLWAQEKYDEAGKAFQELFEIEKSASAEQGIADCKRFKGNEIKKDDELKEKYYHEAIKTYDSILKKNKTDHWAWYSKGLCLWNLKRYSDAQNCQLEPFFAFNEAMCLISPARVTNKESGVSPSHMKKGGVSGCEACAGILAPQLGWPCDG